MAPSAARRRTPGAARASRSTARRRRPPRKCCTSRRCGRAAASTAGRSAARPPGLHQSSGSAARSRSRSTSARRSRPGVVFVPPEVVHGFRFAPETDGLVLTLSPRFASRARRAAGEAIPALFAAPACWFVPDEAVVARHRRAVRESPPSSRAGERNRPLRYGSRAVVWRLARAPRRRRRRGGGAQRTHALSRASCMLVEAHFLERWPLRRYAERLACPRAAQSPRARRGRAPALRSCTSGSRAGLPRRSTSPRPLEKPGLRARLRGPRIFLPLLQAPYRARPARGARTTGRPEPGLQRGAPPPAAPTASI